MSNDVIKRRKASCQHCGAHLVETRAWLEAGQRWVEVQSRSSVCIPAATYPGRWPVLHTPMPDGLRGAPE